MPVDWNSPDWLRRENDALRSLAEEAGRYAYRGPGRGQQAIHREALRFLFACPMLRAYRNPLTDGMIVSRFTMGWRARAAKEQHP